MYLLFILKLIYKMGNKNDNTKEQINEKEKGYILEINQTSSPIGVKKFERYSEKENAICNEYEGKNKNEYYLFEENNKKR